MPDLMTVLAWLSFAIALRFLLQEFFTIKQLIKKYWSGTKENLKQRYGDWAAITGTSDGIGKAFAEQCASRGINIVLIGRNRTKLEKVATELEKDHGIATKIIIADFSKGREIYKSVQEELENVDVGILINNVGIQYNYPMAIADLPEDEIWDNVNVNITSTTMMTRLVLPKMLAKNKGAIVNISSVASCQPQPYMNLYAASKAYVTYFSEALREEVKQSNITIQTLIPAYVSTKINHFQKGLQKVGLFIPDVDTYASSALDCLGVVDFTTGYWPHRVQWFLLSLAPIWLMIKYLNIRYKAYGQAHLKKQAKVQK